MVANVFVLLDILLLDIKNVMVINKNASKK